MATVLFFPVYNNSLSVSRGSVMESLKLVVVGPAGAGKSTIANFIADATEIPYEYRPTKGVRILELEVPNVKVKSKTVKVDVELWDCSGDRQYENYWPAFRKDALGVIFVCGEISEQQTRELEQLYEYFVNQPKLEAKSCVIFHYDPEKIRGNEFFNNNSSPTLARISQVTCNVDDGSGKLKSDFQAFVSTLTARKQERSEQEESTIISESASIFSMR